MNFPDSTVNIIAPFPHFQIIFIQWINETQLTIVENESLTEYEILVQIWYSLKILFQQYTVIEQAVKWVQIGEWGYCFELEGLAIDIVSVGSNTEISIEETFTIDVSGSCPLFVALRGCVEGGSSSDQAAIEVLIQQITVIIQAEYSYSETLVLIYQKFQAFFVEHVELQVVIVASEIEGFGIIGSFFDVCNTVGGFFFV